MYGGLATADYLLLTGPSDTFLTRLKLGLANSGSCTVEAEPRDDSPLFIALFFPRCARAQEKNVATQWTTGNLSEASVAIKVTTVKVAGLTPILSANRTSHTVHVFHTIYAFICAGASSFLEFLAQWIAQIIKVACFCLVSIAATDNKPDSVLLNGYLLTTVGSQTRQQEPASLFDVHCEHSGRGWTIRPFKRELIRNVKPYDPNQAKRA